MKILTTYNNLKSNWYKRKKFLETKGLSGYIRNSNGYVLAIVLIVSTLLIALASEFATVSMTSIRYMRNFDNRLKSLTLARSGMELSKYILAMDQRGVSATFLTGKKTNRNVDCYDDIWAIDFPPFTVGDGQITIKIEDEQSKVNVSVLANEFSPQTKFYPIIQRLMINLGYPMDIADAILDWVDINEIRSPYGAESDHYENLPIPYKSKNYALDSINELLMVKGITPEIFYGLKKTATIEGILVDHNRGYTGIDLNKLNSMSDIDSETKDGFKDQYENQKKKIGKEKSKSLSHYLRVHGSRQDAYSSYNKININTASYRVISALTDKMTDDIVTEIISKRQVQPFTTVSELSSYIDDPTFRDLALTVKSDLFRIKVTGTVDNVSSTIIAVYDRSRRRYLYWCSQ